MSTWMPKGLLGGENSQLSEDLNDSCTEYRSGNLTLIWVYNHRWAAQINNKQMLQATYCWIFVSILLNGLFTHRFGHQRFVFLLCSLFGIIRNESLQLVVGNLIKAFVWLYSEYASVSQRRIERRESLEGNRTFLSRRVFEIWMEHSECFRWWRMIWLNGAFSSFGIYRMLHLWIVWRWFVIGCLWFLCSQKCRMFVILILIQLLLNGGLHLGEWTRIGWFVDKSKKPISFCKTCMQKRGRLQTINGTELNRSKVMAMSTLLWRHQTKWMNDKPLDSYKHMPGCSTYPSSPSKRCWLTMPNGISRASARWILRTWTSPSIEYHFLVARPL